jgi:class 3 adenylate cyclase/FixJ family two-component response regulator
MSKKIILCIDDESTILNSLKTELKSIFSKEYLIEVAESGNDALELVNELLADNCQLCLVISDYLMPQMKGDEVLKLIHDKSPKTIKIMLTGQATLEGVANAIKDAQLYRYMSKPWQTEDFKLTVIEAVGRYTQSQDLEEKNVALEKLNLQQAELIEKLRINEINLQKALVEELKLKEITSRFVPNEFLALLGCNNLIDIHLGDAKQQEMSVLFCDIRDFTHLSESMTASESFKFINSYLSYMEPIISQYHGFIDKYIGDAIMALFSGPANDAIDASIAMLKSLDFYNAQRKNDRQNPPINVGIGINTGSLILGTVGSEKRMDGTVISDAVNLSSRMENLTKHYKVPLLITHHTFVALENPEQYKIRKIDLIKVKGKDELITVYEVFDADSESLKAAKLATLELFNQAISFYNEKNIAQAQLLFIQCLAQNPQDTVSQIYLSRTFNTQWTDANQS